MADTLRIRIYNVRFGDAILVRVPDRNPADGRTTLRHILIDVGNVLRGKDNPLGEGGDDEVFEAVVQDILEQLGGKPLDLYVMTHEHLDHVQGLFHAAAKHFDPGELKARLDTQFAWLTASAHPDYYTTHPKAEKARLALDAAYAAIAGHLQLRPASFAEPYRTLLLNNNTRATAACVAFLRSLAPAGRTHYIHRGIETEGKHPFDEARFDIWAPEEDTSDYYRALLPMALSAAPAAAGAAAVLRPAPPPGVDAGAFYDLVESRASGLFDNLLAIDKAANNTSVVFALEWRGKRLLFAGDAELASWRMMGKQDVLAPVDFIKVSHHGSHNGTPDDALFDAILPAGAQVERCAAISTWEQTYNNIPHTPTNTRLQQRCKLLSTLDAPRRLFYDVELSA